jgi:nucleoside-diphosphate-sugar epimerase
MKKRIILTGAGGFIGRHCISPLLDRGFEVHSTTRYNKEDFTNGKVKWHIVDLLRYSQIERLMHRVKPTHLLHLAWYTKHDEFWNSKENYFWTLASLELLKQFQESGGKRVVMAGTGYEYAVKNISALKRNQFGDVASLYAIFKSCLRVMVEAFSSKAGISSAWARIPYVYGPYEKSQRIVPSAINSFLRGVPIKMKNPRGKYHFVYVQDIADALVALTDTRIEEEVDIMPGKSVSVRDVVFLIAKKLCKPELVKIDKSNLNTRHCEGMLSGSHDLLKKLNWTPKYDLNKGLDVTIDWWKQNEQLQGM